MTATPKHRADKPVDSCSQSLVCVDCHRVPCTPYPKQHRAEPATKSGECDCPACVRARGTS